MKHLAWLWGAIIGGIILPVMTWLLDDGYLVQNHYSRGWLDDFESLYRVQLPLVGAAFGALSIALWKSERPVFLRAFCVLCSLAVTALTWQWLHKLFTLDSRIRPPRGFLVLTAAPVTIWALSLFFLSCVVRSRTALPR